MKAVLAHPAALAKAKRKRSHAVNRKHASRHPQEKAPTMSRSLHNVEKQATNFSESVRIRIEAVHWPIAEHAS